MCRFVFVASLGLLAPASGVRSGSDGGTDGLERLEQGILTEMNKLRADPASFIPALRARLGRFEGKRLRLAEHLLLVTQEGAPAVQEAIDFCKQAGSLGPLKRNQALARAARDHARDLGPAGRTGHRGSDGSSPADRLRRHGKIIKAMAENLAFGDNDARGVVIQLLIDDGVPDRGHRKHIFDPRFKVVGIACGPHAVYRQMCVMDFAGGFVEKGEK